MGSFPSLTPWQIDTHIVTIKNWVPIEMSVFIDTISLLLIVIVFSLFNCKIIIILKNKRMDVSVCVFDQRWVFIFNQRPYFYDNI